MGPNGSGKSNISDALRWVLGEQSPKALRGGKMEEVIFNGTESRRPRGMAEVTLVIDNSAGILDIEYKEVAITRRMFRSGESEYLINENPCRLKDIRELIMDTGIGVDGYSIIGQGKISDIVSNKPESRREIFEEAAGIVAYKTRKHETERKLAATRGNLERIEDIVVEIESRIDKLKEDSEKATRYIELRERYRDLEINIILRNIETVNRQNSQYLENITELSQQLSDAGESRKKADEEFRQARVRGEALDKISEELSRDLIANKDKINSISNKNRLNHEKLVHLRQEETRLSEEVTDMAEAITVSEKENEKLKTDLDEIKKKLTDSEERLRKKIILYDSVTRESSECSEKIDDNNEKIITLNGEAASKKSEAKSYKSYRLTLTERREKLSSEVAELEEEREKKLGELEEKRRETEKLSKQSSKLKNDIKEHEEKRRDLQSNEVNLRRKTEELKLNYSRTEARLHTIREMEQN